MTTKKRADEAALETVIEAYLLGYDPRPSHRPIFRGRNFLSVNVLNWRREPLHMTCPQPRQP